MLPHILCENSDRALERNRPWLVCIEAQLLHFPGWQGCPSGSVVPQVERCRMLLSHARRSGWRVVHVHRRSYADPPYPHDPGLRPIEGLAPLPSEPVYVRSGARSWALPEDPFWRHAAGLAPEQILMIGHIDDRGMVELASAPMTTGVEIAIVQDAMWCSIGASPFENQILPLSTLKRLQAMRGRSRLAPTASDGRYDAANAR